MHLQSYERTANNKEENACKGPDRMMMHARQYSEPSAVLTRISRRTLHLQRSI